ncbi:hypothetical protein FB451DRAFT_1387528 [Mycena latifolia]|nr:hypothetical protein FB451DRAFT_1387528 [Mycena latifolia]
MNSIALDFVTKSGCTPCALLADAHFALSGVPPRPTSYLHPRLGRELPVVTAFNLNIGLFGLASAHMFPWHELPTQRTSTNRGPYPDDTRTHRPNAGVYTYVPEIADIPSFLAFRSSHASALSLDVPSRYIVPSSAAFLSTLPPYLPTLLRPPPSSSLSSHRLSRIPDSPIPSVISPLHRPNTARLRPRRPPSGSAPVLQTTQRAVAAVLEEGCAVSSPAHRVRTRAARDAHPDEA